MLTRAALKNPFAVFAIAVIVDQGTAKRVQVKTGITDGRWIEIIEGLTGGVQVVVVGKSNLTDGTPLTPSPYSLPEGTPSMQRL